MKKHVNKHMLLLALGISLGDIVHAPAEQVVNAKTVNKETSESRKNRQKKEISDLKKQHEHDNRLLNDIDKSFMTGKKARKEVFEISGIKIDPKSPNFKADVIKTKNVFKQVQGKETKELADKHEKQNAPENAILEFNSVNRSAQAKIEAEKAKKLATQEAVSQKRMTEKARKKAKKDAASAKRKASIARKYPDAEKNKLAKKEAKAARKKEFAARKEAKKAAKRKAGSTGVRTRKTVFTQKATEVTKESSAKVLSQKKFLDSAITITSNLKAFDVLRDDEIKKLEQTTTRAQQAIDSGVPANATPAVDAVITLLVKAMVKLNATKLKDKSVLTAKIVTLQNQFNDFKNKK